MWRVSNAVSWIAGSSDDADRKLELQRIAGEFEGQTAEELAEANRWHHDKHAAALTELAQLKLEYGVLTATIEAVKKQHAEELKNLERRYIDRIEMAAIIENRHAPK